MITATGRVWASIGYAGVTPRRIADARHGERDAIAWACFGLPLALALVVLAGGIRVAWVLPKLAASRGRGLTSIALLTGVTPA